MVLTCKYFNKILQNEYIWKIKFNTDFKPIFPKPSNLTYKQYYREIYPSKIYIFNNKLEKVELKDYIHSIRNGHYITIDGLVGQSSYNLQTSSPRSRLPQHLSFRHLPGLYYTKGSRSLI